MEMTIKLQRPADIRRNGIAALLRELGPLGMAAFLEQYDNGGRGDYTKEKYETPDLSLDEILRQLDALRQHRAMK